MSAGSFRARIVLRPRSLDEVFDLALAYLRTFFTDLRLLLATAILVPFLVAAPAALVLAALGRPGVETGVTFVVLFLLTSQLLERAVTVFAGRHLFEAPIRVRDALGHVGQELPVVVLSGGLRWGPAAWIVTAFPGDIGPMIGLLTLWTMLLGLVALLSARTAHGAEVRLLERLRGRAARRRALDLSALRQGRNIGFLVQAILLRSLFVAASFGATEAVFDFVLQFEGAVQVLGPFGAAFGYAVSGPYVALARFFDYVDARTRGEGWDLQVRFQEIAQRAEAAKKGRAA